MRRTFIFGLAVTFSWLLGSHTIWAQQKGNEQTHGRRMGRQGRGGGGAYSHHADGDNQERPTLETEQPYGDSVKQPPTRAHQHAQ